MAGNMSQLTWSIHEDQSSFLTAGNMSQLTWPIHEDHSSFPYGRQHVPAYLVHPWRPKQLPLRQATYPSLPGPSMKTKAASLTAGNMSQLTWSIHEDQSSFPYGRQHVPAYLVHP